MVGVSAAQGRCFMPGCMSRRGGGGGGCWGLCHSFQKARGSEPVHSMPLRPNLCCDCFNYPSAPASERTERRMTVRSLSGRGTRPGAQFRSSLTTSAWLISAELSQNLTLCIDRTAGGR
ncbi:hypothetical protein DPEC_G00014900 [Dallia pectoralis]|uniref:Uncharacterized protein n=1 Tax=Dallia pectoralis TaxID=75939 RepID=A0ACC2HMQ8_DALPE|nr:hypothetical protein DPEC_G00014900 [Dallia pectoralis]